MDWQAKQAYKEMMRLRPTEELQESKGLYVYLAASKAKELVKVLELGIPFTHLAEDAAEWTMKANLILQVLQERERNAKVAAGVMALGACV